MSTFGFDDKNIIPLFNITLEQASAEGLAEKIGMMVKSDSETEDYGFLGANPVMREWIGARQGQVLNKTQYSIRNQEYEASMKIPKRWLERDQSGMLTAKMSAFALEAASGHWLKLVAALIVANGLCYDGQNFFDTDHSMGSSGTQKNEIGATEIPSSNVATTTAPTVTEAANILCEAVGYFKTLKNDQGEPINGEAKNCVVITSTAQMYSAFFQAVTASTLASGVDNPLNGIKSSGHTFEVVMESRLTSHTDKVIIARTDAKLKPFILQTEREIESQVLGEGSQVYFDERAYQLGIDCSRGVGYGLWEYCLRITLT